MGKWASHCTTIFSICLRHWVLKPLPMQRAPCLSGGAGGEQTAPSSPPVQESGWGGSRSSPPTTNSLSSVLAKAFAGTCKNNLQLGLLARRKELEQQHPSKAASKGERGHAPHPGDYIASKIKEEGNKNPRRPLWWKYKNVLVSPEQTDLIARYLLGLHLYHTMRYLPVPGHGSAPNSRLLTRNWQLRLSWHSSSIFCSQGCTQETEKQQHFSISTKGIVKQRETGEQQGHPCLPSWPQHKAGNGAQCSGYHRSCGLAKD